MSWKRMVKSGLFAVTQTIDKERGRTDFEKAKRKTGGQISVIGNCFFRIEAVRMILEVTLNPPRLTSLLRLLRHQQTYPRSSTHRAK